jgi:hypothetical protein
MIEHADALLVIWGAFIAIAGALVTWAVVRGGVRGRRDKFSRR